MDNLATEVLSLEECEHQIQKGISEVGYYLAYIRNNRLYEQEHETFEDYCRERWGWSKRHANRQIDAANIIKNLGPIGPKMPPEGQLRELSGLEPEQQREVYRRAVDTAPDGQVTAKHIQSVREEIAKVPHVANNSGENEWYTPAKFIESARTVMGGIDTDPASNLLANQTVKANIYYTKDDDGLIKEWFGNVWMNPPYAQPLISEFSDALVNKYKTGEFNQACVLVNNATDTAWLQNMLSLCSSICFIKTRVKFIDKDGKPSGAPLQGQVILYYGPNVDLFNHEFSQYGTVMIHP